MALLHSVRGWVLSCHLFGLVFWFGGLLVLTRTLRLHADEPPSARSVLRRLESWLQYFFALPGALLVMGSGAWLLHAEGLSWLRVSLWMQAKLVLVLALVMVHLALWRSQRKAAQTPPHRAVVRGGWRMQAGLIWVLLASLLTLSVLRPFVGGG